jgi:hypothetical protein
MRGLKLVSGVSEATSSLVIRWVYQLLPARETGELKLDRAVRNYMKETCLLEPVPILSGRGLQDKSSAPTLPDKIGIVSSIHSRCSRRMLLW